MRSCPRGVRSWLVLLIGDRSCRIGPVAIGNQRIPAGTAGIAIVRVAAELVEQCVIAHDLFAIERDAEARLVRYANRAVRIAHSSALDHIVDEMMIVRVG